MSVGLMIVMALLVLNIVGMCALWYQLDVLERMRSSQGACGGSRAINEGPMKKGGINPGPKGPKPPYNPPSQRIGRGEEKMKKRRYFEELNEWIQTAINECVDPQLGPPPPPPPPREIREGSIPPPPAPPENKTLYEGQVPRRLIRRRDR